ncbi:MAG TPA: PQQ-dependent sugar dehydrogenase [Opitutaceae bacterium]|jgi:mono/diheme cytochrome c family protein|nr:PQQ-dependent sugar dehydrogenase [Opitutaceae bacterium]
MLSGTLIFAALSALELLTFPSTDRQIVRAAPGRMQSPHFSADGRWLYYNQDGSLYRIRAQAGAAPERIDTGFLTHVNNDHGLSPDGSMLAISDQLAEGRSQIYLLPVAGGTPRRVDAAPPAYWHGWSPDGSTLVYCAARGGNYDVYTQPAAGGPERRLTTAPGNDNGPEYSADGQWIYFHSERTGRMQIWRMRTDGSQQQAVTADDYYNWFPHPSPDGRWIAFLSSRQPPTTGHPPDGIYLLRLLSTAGGPAREVARFYGGNGSLNVPCWSRDSTQIAFASFEPPQGRTLFLQQCASCHALAQDGIGPPLGGVTTVRSHADLLAWIQNPAAFAAAGDRRSRALLARYKTLMPPFAALGRDKIESVLQYLAQVSAAAHLAAFVVPATTGPAPLLPPVRTTRLVVELQDVAQLPRLPGRTPYKGITLVRADPRAPGGLLVLDLMGVIYQVRHGQIGVFLDMRRTFPEFAWEPGVATGLGSFALHPDFVRNGLFYTTHAERFRHSPAINGGDIPPDVPPGATPPLEWVLTEWNLHTGSHRQVLRFVTPTTAHAAQEIAFAPVGAGDPDYGRLYIEIGDGGSVNLKRPDMAGHPRTLLGSILRIDPAGRDGFGGGYGIPADNPFAAASDPRIHREIWAYGFRNPHRMSWDFAYGRRMIAVDIGESNAEEVNLIRPGGSYGWGAARLEGTLHIEAATDAKVVRHATPAELAGHVPPFAEYDHTQGAAITGGYVYHGPLALLRDKYVFGDIVTGRLFYLNFGPRLDDHSIYEIRIVRRGAITSLKELGHLDRAHLRIGYDARSGDLYLTTKGDGMLRRICAAYEVP